LDLICGTNVKGTFAYDASTGKTYLGAYSSGSPSELHFIGSKIVAENDMECLGLLKVNDSDPYLVLQHSSSDRITIGYNYSGDGHNYFRARNAGNMDFVNENGSINFTCSSGLMYTVGSLQIVPNTTNTGAVGTPPAVGNGFYAYSAAYTVYAHTSGAFDEYDDLALVKQWGEKEPAIPKEYNAKLKPKDDDPFSMLRGEHGRKDDGFFDLMAVSSFALGCAKALAKHHDENSDIMLALYDGIDVHDSKIQALENEIKTLKEALNKIQKGAS
jgi:hypothetical protein